MTLCEGEDGYWVVECPALPGCLSQGKTREEALEMFQKAISVCLRARAEDGLPLTMETRRVEVTV